MANLLLAIDGGGSKTHALIATPAGETVEEAVVAAGSNPWKSGGFERAATVIDAVLKKCVHLSDVVLCVAGISGCHSDNTFSARFRELLAARLPQGARIMVEGDLITSFCASSPHPYGQLAIAGSGSAIAHFYPDGTTYAYDGIGYGGRDIGAAIIASVQRSEQPPVVVKWLETVLGEPPAHLSKLGDVYHHQQVLAIVKELARLPLTDETAEALQPLLQHCAWRWAYKLWGTSQKYRTRASLEADAPIYTILSGNTWRLDTLTQKVSSLLQQSDPANQLVY